MQPMLEAEKDEALMKALIALSKVMVEHNLALIARVVLGEGSAVYPVIGFQLNNFEAKQATHVSNRCHASGHELTLMVSDIKHLGRRS